MMSENSFYLILYFLFYKKNQSVGFQVCSCQVDLCNVDYDTCCDTYRKIESDDEISINIVRNKKLTTSETSTTDKTTRSAANTILTNIVTKPSTRESSKNATNEIAKTRNLTKFSTFKKLSPAPTRAQTVLKTYFFGFSNKNKFLENLAIYLFKLVLIAKYYFNGILEYLQT